MTFLVTVLLCCCTDDFPEHYISCSSTGTVCITQEAIKCLFILLVSFTCSQKNVPPCQVIHAPTAINTSPHDPVPRHDHLGNVTAPDQPVGSK